MLLLIRSAIIMEAPAVGPLRHGRRRVGLVYEPAHRRLAEASGASIAPGDGCRRLGQNLFINTPGQSGDPSHRPCRPGAAPGQGDYLPCSSARRRWTRPRRQRSSWFPPVVLYALKAGLYMILAMASFTAGDTMTSCCRARCRWAELIPHPQPRHVATAVLVIVCIKRGVTGSARAFKRTILARSLSAMAGTVLCSSPPSLRMPLSAYQCRWCLCW